MTFEGQEKPGQHANQKRKKQDGARQNKRGILGIVGHATGNVNRPTRLTNSTILLAHRITDMFICSRFNYWPIDMHWRFIMRPDLPGLKAPIARHCREDSIKFSGVWGGGSTEAFLIYNSPPGYYLHPLDTTLFTPLGFLPPKILYVAAPHFRWIPCKHRETRLIISEHIIKTL